jgi:hypothetical protein
MKYNYQTYKGDLYSRERHLLLKNIPIDLLKILKENNTYILGGALTSIFTNNKINDIDLYFKDIEAIEKVNKYINDEIILKNKKGELLFKSDNAITYKIEGHIIQLIIKVIGKIYDIMDQFDYTICLAGYDISSDTFEFPQEFLLHNSQKKLVFTNNTKYPICSMFRLNKYINRGYKITGIEMIKIALAINNLNLENYIDLKEQLEGIDTFMLQDLTKEFLDKQDVEYNYQRFLDDFQVYLQKYYDKKDIVKDMFEGEQ